MSTDNLMEDILLGEVETYNQHTSEFNELVRDFDRLRGKAQQPGMREVEKEIMDTGRQMLDSYYNLVVLREKLLLFDEVEEWQLVEPEAPDIDDEWRDMDVF